MRLFRPELLAWQSSPYLMKLPEHLWPPVMAKLSLRPVEVWLSGDFLAQVYPEIEGACRVTVCRSRKDDNDEWLADVTWEELMRVKREIGCGETWAVEVFPADPHKVDVANMRHLWLLPEPPPYAWTRA